MTKRVAIYVRVSTDGQTTDNQLRELKTVAERSDWEIVEVFADHGISGAKGRSQRPEFDRLLKHATQRKFDIVGAWSVDRLGRSMRDLLDFLDELKAVGVDLYLHQQALDTTTPSGRAFFQMVGVFAEFERSMIQERVKSGLARAKERGQVLGRRQGSRNKRITRVTTAVKRLRREGKSIRAIADEVGVSPNTVIKLTREIEATT
jgi:DNA invertase Pin-like site-specific DNA recombinase